MHLSDPEEHIDFNNFPIVQTIKNLVLLFNGTPEFSNFTVLNSLNLNTFTINLNTANFIKFWNEISDTLNIKTLNLYLHLKNFQEFRNLFLVENEQILKIFKKVFVLNHNKRLNCLNLNILFDCSIIQEVNEIRDLNLKTIIYKEYKFYFGYLELFSLNLIINADKTYFLFAGLGSKFVQEKLFCIYDKSLSDSLKLSNENDISIFFSLKKKKLGNAILSNVFKFLAVREYTIVNLSKICYLK